MERNSYRKTVLLLTLTIALLVSVNFVSARQSDDYLNEFSVPGESCTKNNFFQYYTSDKSFFDDTKYMLKFPVLYQCCKNQSDCLSIIFDPLHEEFLTNEQNVELFHLNFLEKNLENYTIPVAAYDMETSFDICEYFGVDTLRQESTNVLAIGAEKAVPYLDPKTAKAVSLSLNSVKALGLIESVNPSALISSVACYADSRKVNEVLENLASCSSYLKNIKNNVALEGYISELNRCNVDVRAKLNSYVDSTWASLKGSIDTVGNAVTGAFSFFISFAREPNINHELNIQRSEYDQLKSIRDTMDNRKASFKFDESPELVSKQNTRILFKTNASSSILQNVSAKGDEAKKLRPNKFKIFITNIFIEPNFNYTEADLFIEQSESSLIEGKMNLKRYKFNSAIKDATTIEEAYLASIKSIEQEANTKRHVDRKVIGTIIAITLIVLVVFIVNKRKNKADSEFV